MRVLLVDNSRLVRQRLLALLGESCTLELYEADGLEQARRLLDRVAVELALVDIRLGAGSGLELIHDVKRCRPHALVAVMTNDATTAHERACLARGADFFFDKSRDFERLVELVKGLGRSAAEQA